MHPLQLFYFLRPDEGMDLSYDQHYFQLMSKEFWFDFHQLSNKKLSCHFQLHECELGRWIWTAMRNLAIVSTRPEIKLRNIVTKNRWRLRFPIRYSMLCDVTICVFEVAWSASFATFFLFLTSVSCQNASASPFAR